MGLVDKIRPLPLPSLLRPEKVGARRCVIGRFRAEGWPQPLGLEGIEAIVFRTVGDQPSLFESVLPEPLLRLAVELARVDALLDDPVFSAPFVPFFDPRIGRPSTPMETYLRMRHGSARSWGSAPRPAPWWQTLRAKASTRRR